MSTTETRRTPENGQSTERITIIVLLKGFSINEYFDDKGNNRPHGTPFLGNNGTIYDR